MISSVVKRTSRLLSTRGMRVAYSKWLWSSLADQDGPSIHCMTTDIRGWISFSDYWSFYGGIAAAEGRLLDFCLRTSTSLKPVAFDIGANLGIFSAELAGRGFSSVHAFEPAPATFKKLRKNIEDSPCTRGIVKLNSVAVGAESGWVEFELQQHSPATNHIRLSACEAESAQSVQRVPITTLDLYCEENGIDHIDFLKTDTEGFEPFVLQGAQKCAGGGRIPIILLEICPELLVRSGSSVRELYVLLESLGYSLRRLQESGLPGGELRPESLERISCANVVAISRNVWK